MAQAVYLQTYGCQMNERDSEEILGIRVRRPRYLMVPKIGMWFQDRAYALAIRDVVREEAQRMSPDVIDAHYLYPDVCAVARVARELGLPFIASARGSDVKRLGRIPGIARRIRVALKGARGIVAMSRDLAEEMRGLCDGDVATCGACGDVNQDRRLDIADGIRCRALVLAGGFPATCCDEFRADFQRDGDVDLDDCRAIEDWQLAGGPGCGES